MTPCSSMLVSSIIAVSPSKLVIDSPNSKIVSLLIRVTDCISAENNSPLTISSLSWNVPPVTLITSICANPLSITVAKVSENSPCTC